jgi:hypothetical protein
VKRGVGWKQTAAVFRQASFFHFRLPICDLAPKHHQPSAWIAEANEVEKKRGRIAPASQ